MRELHEQQSIAPLPYCSFIFSFLHFVRAQIYLASLSNNRTTTIFRRDKISVEWKIYNNANLPPQEFVKRGHTASFVHKCFVYSSPRSILSLSLLLSSRFSPIYTGEEHRLLERRKIRKQICEQSGFVSSSFFFFFVHFPLSRISIDGSCFVALRHILTHSSSSKFCLISA